MQFSQLFYCLSIPGFRGTPNDRPCLIRILCHNLPYFDEFVAVLGHKRNYFTDLIDVLNRSDHRN